MSLEGRHNPGHRTPSVLEKDRPIYRPTEAFSLQEYVRGEHAEFFARLGESVNKRRFNPILKRLAASMETGAPPKLTESQRLFLDDLVSVANERRGQIERIQTWFDKERFAAAVHQHPGLSALAHRIAPKGDMGAGSEKLRELLMGRLDDIAIKSPAELGYAGSQIRIVHDMSRREGFRDAKTAVTELAEYTGVSEDELWSELSRVPVSERVNHLRDVIRKRHGFFSRVFHGGARNMAENVVERANHIETTPELLVMEHHLGLLATGIASGKTGIGLRDAVDRALISPPTIEAPRPMGYESARTRMSEMTPTHIKERLGTFLNDEPGRITMWADETNRDALIGEFEGEFLHHEGRRLKGQGVIARMVHFAIRALLGGADLRAQLKRFAPPAPAPRRP